ncbi:unnamed protein product, partial [Mesorhabditis belari]|uniref:UPAR/Ly6 domain-containing protein n=1 Tax=Mesorhabditis belari TaxID=2138241 RepID=A0AAF3EF36_9BILA
MLSNTQWIYLEIFLLCLLNQVSAIVDCTHGFVGRMQASLSDDYIHINDTRMCAADWCIQVVIHGAYDDDNTFQQGVSSRCGYTGGDRSICQRSQSCTQISFYDGMKGNFSFCCCRETECNRPTAHLIDEIYGRSVHLK